MFSRNLMGLAGLLVVASIFGATASDAAVRFGAKLTTSTFPSNTGIEPKFCNDPEGPPHPKCTWVEMQAYSNGPKGHKAPMDGTIGKIRLISCVPGSFKLQIARANAALREAKVVRDGPIIRYEGDPDRCDNNKQKIESFNVNVKVKKGDMLAIKTNKTAMLRCDSGGDKILMFAPPLMAGAGVEEADFDSGCFLLLEAEYK